MLALILLSAQPALAQDTTLAVDIQGPGQAKMNLAMARPFAGGGQVSPAQKPRTSSTRTSSSCRSSRWSRPRTSRAR